MSQLVQIDRCFEVAPAVRKSNLNWQLLALAVPTVWLYYSILSHLVVEWWKDPNFSHGFIVLIFSLYLVLRDRSQLQILPRKPSWWGLAVVAFAMGVLMVGVLGAEPFLSRVSLLFLTLGFLVLFAGWKYSRALFFPWAFLLLTIPIPAIVMNQITMPLQILASQIAAEILPWLGVPVLREGNIINLPAMPLEVAEACSGIRSIIALAALAIIYGQFRERSRSIRLLLVFATLPLAVLANSLRIVGTGLLVQYWGPDKAEGFFHSFSGWFIFLLSLAMLFGLHKWLVWGQGMTEARNAG